MIDVIVSHSGQCVWAGQMPSVPHVGDPIAIDLHNHVFVVVGLMWHLHHDGQTTSVEVTVR